MFHTIKQQFSNLLNNIFIQPKNKFLIMKKILSMILLLCAAFSVQLRAEEFTAGKPVYIQGKAANADWGTTYEYLTEMTHLGNGVYTWTGALKQDAFRFVCEVDKGWDVMAFEAVSENYGVSGGYVYPVNYNIKTEKKL